LLAGAVVQILLQAVVVRVDLGQELDFLLLVEVLTRLLLVAEVQ
jgi:hypothetical protein